MLDLKINLKMFFIVWMTLFQLSSATILPPRLRTNATEIRVKEGQTSVVLECILELGDNPISYQWLKNNEWVTGSLGYAYRDYKKVLLALHSIQKKHHGTYICKASNSAGIDSQEIKVIVEEDPKRRKVQYNPDEQPLPEDILIDLAASLNDVLAEGDCKCDIMNLIHANPDLPKTTIGAQANFIHTIMEPLISENMRISVQTYTDYLESKLSFKSGTNRCALRKAFEDLSLEMWPTRLENVLRQAFKSFKKSTNKCKVLFLPIFGSVGQDGTYVNEAKKLRKFGVTIFILDITKEPTLDGPSMASTRGDGKPYYWYFPYSTWPSLIKYMHYMIEDLLGCEAEEHDIEGVCVGPGGACETADQCHGTGMGCVDGICKFMECNADSSIEGCCAEPGDFWCGDVTKNCTSSANACDGHLHCMNGKDETRCEIKPCHNKITRCQTSHLCLGLRDLCDGHSHCPGGEDEDPRFCKNFPCPADRPFRCRNGKCIAKENLCDGAFMHCSEGEDEDLGYCSKIHTCPLSANFKCDYGICLKEESVCDGVFNCLDALDEITCVDKNCPADRPFKCDDGVCIEEFNVCNGYIDGCNDGSDERNCTEFICPFDRSYKCDNGICIDRWLECNGQNDCKDNSDENHCTTSTSTISTTTAESTSSASTTDSPTFKSLGCQPDEFQCISGSCILQDQVCDSRPHCLEGEDELDCTNRDCPRNRPFRCKNNACVAAKVCDNIPDCSDSSDEENCTEYYESSTSSPTSSKPSENPEEDIPIDEGDSGFDIESSPIEDTENVMDIMDEGNPSVAEPEASSERHNAAGSVHPDFRIISVFIYMYYLVRR